MLEHPGADLVALRLAELAGVDKAVETARYVVTG